VGELATDLWGGDSDVVIEPLRLKEAAERGAGLTEHETGFDINRDKDGNESE
jgi:hypothetical protein